MSPPTFFFSHARQDREMPGKYLTRFFEDLEKKVAQVSGIDLKESTLGKIDSRIEHGNDWDSDLSQGVAQSRTFLAVLTPLYFNRVNCGKEIFVFIKRSAPLQLDRNGALVGVKNLLPIRWLSWEAYTLNTVKDGRIPAILRRIEDVPSDAGGDPDRARLIEVYRKRGLEKLVRSGRRYDQLLEMLALRIRDMPDLQPIDPIHFADASDAFAVDWQTICVPQGNCGTTGIAFAAAAVAGATPRVERGAAEVLAAPPVPSASAAPVVPHPLASIVAFYVTRRSFSRDSVPVDFADQLIALSDDGTARMDPALADLIADVHAAGAAERLTVFHAASSPALPDRPGTLINRLAELSKIGVPTMLIVDSAVWSARQSDPAVATIESVATSSAWGGMTLVAPLDGRAPPTDMPAPLVALGARLVTLPQESGPRVAALRTLFVRARGQCMQVPVEPASGARRVPLLKGVAEARP